jgi:hypothetical protein
LGISAAEIAAAKKPIPVGLELYSVRGGLAKDLPGTVRAVAKQGYQVVEFYGPYYSWTLAQAKENRKLLDDLGIRCNSTHNDARNLTAEFLPKAIELNQALGSKYIVMASSGRVEGLDGWRKVAGTLTQAADTLRPLGLRTGYHNHKDEFVALEGRRPIEVIAAGTPRDAMLQFDVGPCVDASQDPVARINSRRPNPMAAWSGTSSSRKAASSSASWKPPSAAWPTGRSSRSSTLSRNSLRRGGPGVRTRGPPSLSLRNSKFQRGSWSGLSPKSSGRRNTRFPISPNVLPIRTQPEFRTPCEYRAGGSTDVSRDLRTSRRVRFRTASLLLGTSFLDPIQPDSRCLATTDTQPRRFPRPRPFSLCALAWSTSFKALSLREPGQAQSLAA